MNTYTDDQLKKALAKLLPNVIDVELSTSDDSKFSFRNIVWKEYTGWPQVKNTELLHLCWMVEDGLKREEQRAYTKLLHPKHFDHLQADFLVLHSTWQQRVIALCKVKGVEIV